MDDKIIKTHESFGQLEICRQQSNVGTPLYGSSIKCENTIRLTIHSSEEHRSLHRFWFFQRRPLIQIEMSPVQFAEAITSLNTTGIPCTIRVIDGVRMENPPIESVHEIFNNELQKDINEIMIQANDLSRNAEQILRQPGGLNKESKSTLLGILFKLKQNIIDNLPFLHKSVVRQLNKSSHEVKSELDAHITHTITKLGQEALKERIEFPISLIQIPEENG